MQLIILAAGRGTRMGDLTNELPKPLLKVNGKSLLEHKFDQLPESIDEVIFVVGYLGDKIKAHFGDSWQGRKISYVVQEELNGTGGAVHCAKDLITGKFAVMMGDDLYIKPDMEKCLTYDWAILVQAALEPTKTGKVIVDQDGHLKDIIEGSVIEKGDLINTGFYTLQPEFFELPLVKIDGKEEYGLPQTLLQLVDKVPIKMVNATFWRQVTSPEDLIEAEKYI